MKFNLQEIKTYKQAYKKVDSISTVQIFVQVGLIPALIVFAINYFFLDPFASFNYQSIGFVLLIIGTLTIVFVVAGVIILLSFVFGFVFFSKLHEKIIVEAGKFVAKAILRNKDVPAEMADGIHKHLRELMKNDPNSNIMIQELEAKIERKDAELVNRMDQRDQQDTEVNILKTDIEKLKEDRKIDMDAYQELYKLYWTEKWKNMKLEKEKKENDQIASEKIHVQSSEANKPKLKDTDEE